MKTLKKTLIICFIALGFISCSNDDGKYEKDDVEILYQNDIYSVSKIKFNSKELNELKRNISIIEKKNELKSIIDFKDLKPFVFKISAFQNNIDLMILEINKDSYKSDMIEGFTQKDYLMIGENLINDNINFNIYSVKTKNDIIIEEVKDLFTGQIHSYNLDGINDDEYLAIADYMDDKRTICFSSFDDCYFNLENRIAEDSEDDAICSVLWCGAINYGVCAIARGSGYIQGTSNYIGDSRCDAIYDRNGNNLKDNAE